MKTKTGIYPNLGPTKGLIETMHEGIQTSARMAKANPSLLKARSLRPLASVVPKAVRPATRTPRPKSQAPDEQEGQEQGDV